MQSINECYSKVKKDCIRYISSQETRTEKFKKKDKMIKSFLIPVCFWLANRVKKKKYNDNRFGRWAGYWKNYYFIFN